MAFEVKEMRFVDKDGSPRTALNWAYINFLQVGNKIIMPIFNIKEDAIAWQYIHEAFPECEIHQIEMAEVAEEGGAYIVSSLNIRR
jgi:agmatine/peptidylarginine deiminase